MRSSPWVSVFLVAFGALFVAGGVGAAYAVAIRPMANAREARAWPETTCRVTDAEIVLGRSRKGNRTTYRAEVSYAYEVAGQPYAGSRLAFTLPKSSNDRGDAEAIVARYPVGADVPCWYDPADPASATLSRTVPPSFWMAFPIPFLAFGLGILRFGARLARHRGLGEPTADGRLAYHRRGGGLPELIAMTLIVAAAGVVAYLGSDLGHTRLAWIAFWVMVVAGGWLAHELRCALSVVTIVAPAQIERKDPARIEHVVRTPFCAPPLTAEAQAFETTRSGKKHVERKISTIEIRDGVLRIDGPATREGSASLDWYIEVRTHLPYGPDLYVRAPIRVL